MAGLLLQGFLIRNSHLLKNLATHPGLNSTPGGWVTGNNYSGWTLIGNIYGPFRFAGMRKDDPG